MTQLATIRRRGTATLAAVGAASLIAACGSSGHKSNSAAASGTPASEHGAQITLASGHLSGPGGRSLYMWERDSHDKSNCSGACASAWPPLLTTSKAIAGHGVNAGDLSTIARGAKRQVTYHGHPLYEFAGDSRGTTHGQGSDGFGARWWLVSPSGAAITTHSSGKSSSGGYY